MPSHKYARIEVERRFLLRELPPDLSDHGEYTRIIDSYVDGTRLRLRRMETPNGEVVERKLGQKYPAEQGGLLRTVITNIYLNAHEYQALSALPGLPLVKRRYKYLYDGQRFSIDALEGPLAGLILAEIEFDDLPDLPTIAIPPFALREVTGEPFFTGAALARLTPAAFQEWLESQRLEMTQ